MRASRFRFGLKTRFVASCLLLVSISTAGFYYAVAQLIEVLEVELIDVALESELNTFVREYQHDPQTAGPRARGLNSYLRAPDAHESDLPSFLHGVGPGIHDEKVIEGREIAIGRADINGASLYVVRDMEPVERLETRFVSLAWLCALVSWFAAVALALWLAQRVLRPVAELSAVVGALQPGDYKRRLAPEFGHHEIGAIATAFDRFLKRLESFVAREQAFTEDASHELRTPLSVIDSSTQLLAEDPQLAPASKERLHRIERAVAQMQMLIDALLFLAREDGQYASQALQLDVLVYEIAENLREQIEAKGLTLELRTQPAAVHVPQAMAISVISNLIHNAIHYTDKGGIVVSVESGRVRVADSGRGIAPQDLEHIFERRFRGSHSRGLGLGLYLVKRICDRLRWRVRVERIETGGTLFEIAFDP